MVSWFSAKYEKLLLPKISLFQLGIQQAKKNCYKKTISETRKTLKRIHLGRIQPQTNKLLTICRFQLIHLNTKNFSLTLTKAIVSLV